MGTTSKIALVTGSTKRIGDLLSSFLEQEEWKVIRHYNNDIITPNESSNQIIERCDFNDIKATENFIPNLTKKYGEISLLINNAAIFTNDHYNDFEPENMLKTLKINSLSPAILIKSFCAQLSKNQKTGNIINISDYCTTNTPDNFYSYTLSKMFLNSLTNINAKLIAPNIRINTILLGSVLKTSKQSDKNFVESYKQSPLKIETTAQDIASTIEFIIKTKCITGEEIHLDSGKRFIDGLFK